MIPTPWHSGKGQTLETADRSVVARVGVEGETNHQSTESNWGGESALSGITVMSTCHYVCVQPIESIECATPAVNPKANCGFWVIIYDVSV